jgi:hypothetical protein
MPKTPYSQGPPSVEASGSGRTNLQIDHEEMTDAAKQRRPESDLGRPPGRCRNIRHIHASVALVGGALFDDMPGQTWRFVP